MKLSDLKNNDRGVIAKVRGRGAFRKRITEMGFVKGKLVTVVKNAPLKDPVEYNIMGYELSLRRSEAALIDVVSEQQVKSEMQGSFEGVTTGQLKTSARERGHVIDVALVGNPNAGKTSLFNKASGAKERVGNYSGVTVDLKRVSFKHQDYRFNMIDLPGTYSLTAYSPEELYVRRYIHNSVPDVIVNVVDASNLERNLYLTTQLIDMDVKVVIALNMYDEMQAKGDQFDYEKLGKMIGIPIIPTIAAKGTGIKELLNKVIEVYNDEDPSVRHIHINYGHRIEKALLYIQEHIKIPSNYHLTDRMSSRFIAIKLLEKDQDAREIIKQCTNYPTIERESLKQIKKLEQTLNEDSETIMTDAKYGFISGAMHETYRKGKIQAHETTKRIDHLATHKFWGFPIFFLFMWLMFQSTFTLGKYPMLGLEVLVEYLSAFVEVNMANGMLKDLLIDGIIGGVGGVIVFLPNILILFLFISFMEDTGYMARAAFIMDKIMHKIGLHGKSFIPLVMGFGCNVPAIMATRTIESRNDRLLTMLINPLMSCSARLPVYILLIGAFFPKYQGLLLFAIYATGIFLAVVVAIIFKKLFFRSKDVPFVMELPPYRMPTVRAVTGNTWRKGVQYLRKMGGVILVASIIIWALGYFPRAEKNKSSQTNTQVSMNEATQVEKDSTLTNIDLDQAYRQQENSYIGRMGKLMTPVLTPLGFDWRMGVALIAGTAGKELVVSTLGVLFQAEGHGAKENEALKNRLQEARYQSGPKEGRKVFTPLSVIAFLLFILVYFPCIAVITAIKNESGGWKWALFTVVYTTGLACLLALIAYQVGSLFI